MNSSAPANPLAGTFAVTQLFADFVVNSEWTALPAAARHNVLASAVNTMANMVGGTHDDSVDRLLQAMSPFMGPPVAHVLGRSTMADVPSAAFLNAVSANVLDFDDTHLPTLVHPGSVVLGALLALSSRRKVSGAELLHALAIGIEIDCRLGLALHPGHYERGWHITTTCGAMAAAAASARLLGLDATGVRNAIGIAATCASGIVENLSTMAKSVGVGNAARNGLMAALMAEAGMDASPTALEGTHGFLHVACDRPNLKAAVDGLGQRWELINRCDKPYPSCALAFPVIDAVLELQGHPAIAAAGIERVQVTGSPLMLVRNGRATVATAREAKLSVRHCVAIALRNGSASVPDYLDSTVADPQTVALAALVDVTADESMASDAAEVRIRTRDGQTLIAHVAQGRGSPQRPLTRDELDAKARTLLAWGEPTLAADEVMASLWDIENAADVRDIQRLAQPRRTAVRGQAVEA